MLNAVANVLDKNNPKNNNSKNNSNKPPKLTVLCCTANMGNAAPSLDDLEQWIPSQGLIIKSRQGTASQVTCDLIVIGMQEATWKKKKKKSKKTKSKKKEDNDDNDNNAEEFDDHSESSEDEEEEHDESTSEDYDDDAVSPADASLGAVGAAAAGVREQLQATSTTLSPQNKKNNNTKSPDSTHSRQRNKEGSHHSRSSNNNNVLTKQNSSMWERTEDTILLRNHLMEIVNGNTDSNNNNNTGESNSNTNDLYDLVQEYQRGQMRLYLLVRKVLVPHISQVQVKAENTGIGGVYHNKGGIMVHVCLGQTRLTFLTAHLAAHEGSTQYKSRNDHVREILRGARPQPKHLQWQDASIVSHHMFVMGDLNYRLRIPSSDIADAISDDDAGKNNKSGGDGGSSPTSHKSSSNHKDDVAAALKIINEGDFAKLYSYDELWAGIQKKEVLCQFQTMPCHFSPTFKVQRTKGFQYKTQRVPSYTDRILYTSAEQMEKKLKPLAYEPCPDFSTSDHKPIRGVFTIKLNGTLEQPTADTDPQTEPVLLTFSDMKCSNLRAMDVDGSSDPYIMFVCDPVGIIKDDRKKRNQKYRNDKYKWPRTSYIQKSLNPHWKETVSLCIPSTTASIMNGSMLYLTVMDYDMSTQDDVMCSLGINLSELVSLNDDEDNKTVQINRPLLKYGLEEGNIQCAINVQRGGSQNGGHDGKKRGILGGLVARLSQRNLRKGKSH